MEPTPPAPRRRRFWPKLLLILFLLVVGLIGASPWLAAPFVRRGVVAAAAEQGFDAKFVELSLGWPGRAHLAGLVLRDETGYEQLRVDRADASVHLLRALRGRFEVVLRAEGVRMVVEENDDGTWSTAGLGSKAGDATAPPAPGGGDEPSTPAAKPIDLFVDVELSDIELEVRRPSGNLRVRLDDTRLNLDGLDRPASFVVRGEVSGDGLVPGALDVSGDLVAAPASGEPTVRLDLALALGGSDGLSVALQANAAGERARGALVLSGEIAPAFTLLGSASPLAPGTSVGGRITASAKFEGSTSGGTVQADLGLTDLVATDAQGAPLDLSGLGAPHLELSASSDLDAGRAELASLAGTFGPVTITGSGRVRDLDGDAPALDDASLKIDADLDALRAALAPLVDFGETTFGGRLLVDLQGAGAGEALALKGGIRTEALAFGELRVDGAPFVLDAHLTGAADARRLAGTLTTARLAVDLDAERRVEERDLVVAFSTDLAAPAADPTVALRAGFGRVDLARGTGEDAWHATLDLALDALAAHARSAAGLAGFEAGGRLTGDVEVALAEAAPLAYRADLVAAGLDVTWPVEGAEVPAHVVETRLALTANGTFDSAADVLWLDALGIDSETLRGTLRGRVTGLAAPPPEEGAAPTPLVLEGVRGDLQYVPVRLAAWLAPWLPGELTGDELEPLKVAYDGTLDELDLTALVGPGDGKVEVGLGSFVVMGLRAGGTVVVEKAGGATKMTGDLSANDGVVQLRTRLGGLEEGKGGSVHLELDAVRAAAGLAPALALVHPAFAAVEDRGDLSGILDASLDLVIDGELSAEDLRDPTSISIERISGTGRLSLSQAALSGSPFLSQVFELLGEDASQAFDLEELSFRVQNGRVAYDEPWTWRIQGVDTSFAGALLLDGGLELDWRIPITERLVRKHTALKPLIGRELQVPIRGSALAPKIKWQGVFEQAAKDALQAELKSRIGVEDAIDDVLGDLLGGGKKAADEKSGDPGKSNDPAVLLAEADRLWDAGEKKKAAKIYDRLDSDFKISTVYLLNRDKIRDRRKVKD